jgi:hypothetical protein
MLEKDPAKRPADCLVLAKQLDSIRKKLERKDQGTRVGQSDTVAQTKAVFDPRTSPGPITLAERLGHVSSPHDQRGTIGRIFNHPVVLVTLLAACLGLICYAFFRPVDEDQLFHSGLVLMRSDRLSDKETAWRDYFEPILRHNPDSKWQLSIEKLRKRLEAARDPNSRESWRLLALAEQKLSAGDSAGAEAIWRHVGDAFDGIEDDKDAVEEAKLRFAGQQLDTEKIAERVRRLRPVFDRAAALNAQGKRADAERIWTALDELYRGDPAGGIVSEQVRKARAK